MPRPITFQRALAGVAFLCATAHAQLPAPPATTEDALRQMFDQAAIIFTGQVTAVRHTASANGSTGTLEIDFSIDDAIRGSASHTTYTLREWAGLAPDSVSPFLAGHRYLMLLHSPGPSGLTSPVGGPDGVIPIVPGNDAASPTAPDAAGLAVQASLAQASHFPARTNIRIAAAQPDSDAGALASTNPLASSTIDLRWIATRVLTPLAYLPSEPAAARPIVARAYSIRSSTNFLAPEGDRITPNNNLSAPSVTGAVEPATSSLNYPGLLALLHSWQAHSHAAR
ncbi:MAG TPA: hypothetical protein VN678_03630 [Acidobacteriaceae bacterium]|nr:hypothetical protein [Acidobacteriaceae bacterium]